MRIFIVAPDIFAGDAVGNHCLGLLRAARRLGWEAYAFAERFSGDVSSFEKLFEEITSEDLLVVSYSIYDPNLEKLLTFRGRKICYFHGVTTPGLLEQFEPVTAALCERSYQQFRLLKGFDRVLANSSWTAQILPFFSEEKIQVLPPVCSDMHFLKPEGSFENIKNKREMSDSLNLLAVGRIVPHKRIEDFIQLVSELSAIVDNVKAKIVGSAPNQIYFNLLIEMTERLGLKHKIDFTGTIDEKALLQSYEEADVLVSCSHHEGFCVPVLEAMHLGVPVFVREGTAATELGGKAIRVFHDIFDARKSLLSFYRHPSIQREMAAGGKERAAEILAMVSDDVLDNLFREMSLVQSDS